MPVWLSEWKELIASAVTLLAAAIAWWGVQGQIRQAKEQAEAERERLKAVDKREEEAAKAALPLALNALSGYALDCMRALAPLIDRGDQPSVPLEFAIPAIPVDAVTTLQKCIRYSDTETAKKMATIVMKLQVQNARLDSDAIRYRGRPFFRHNGVQWLLDSADLYQSVVSLFEYARDEEALRSRATPAELKGALANAGVHNSYHPALVEIERLAKQAKGHANLEGQNAAATEAAAAEGGGLG